MALTKVTYSMIDGPVANVVDFGADPTGVADSYAAIQAAYDSDAAIIQFPAGTFKMTQTLYIDRGVTINGSGAQDGSTGNGQGAGVSSTVLNYTGTGNCIDIVGSYTEGVSSVHLSNFMIDGNTLADGGLYIGSGVVVSKCTFKNLGIFNFDNATTNKGYGVGIENCLESIFENIYVHGCNDGFNIGFGATTSCQFLSCFSRVNNQYGWNIRQGNGFSFYQCMAEANLKTGLVLNPGNGQNLSQIAFYSWYSEFNSIDADTYPGALISSTGTGACGQIYFYEPIFYDYSTYNYGTNVWDIALIKLGAVNAIQFTDASCISTNSNFIECQSNTTGCEWQGYSSSKVSVNITNNTFSNNELNVKTTGQQTPGFGALDVVTVTDAFTNVWTIPASTNGLLMVTGGSDGRYGGSGTFVVCRNIGNAGVAATSTFVGDASGYTTSWQLTGNNFELRHNQAGLTFQAYLYFMPVL
jgi:hypothetical protein